MIRIYGASDDLIEIDGPISDEIGCYNNTKNNIICSDGTRAIIDYGDEWKIKVIAEGSQFQKLIISVGEDVDHTDADAKDCSSYSDVLVLNNGVVWIKIGGKIFKHY